MYELYFTKIFEKKLKTFLRKHSQFEKDIKEKLDLLIKNPFSQHLKTHKLSGPLKNQWAISLTYEYRILFMLEENKIFLTNIGTHDEVY